MGNNKAFIQSFGCYLSHLPFMGLSQNKKYFRIYRELMGPIALILAMEISVHG